MRKLKFFLSLLMLFTFSWGLWATDYQKVTSTADLVAGAHYVIGCPYSTSNSFIAVTSNTNNRKITTADVTNDKVTATSDMMTFTLGGSSGAWTFKTDNYGGTAGYLNATNTTKSNYLQVVADLDDYAYFSIDITSGTTTITCNGKDTRNIMYLNGTTCFACYNSQTGSQYVKPSLYKEVATASPSVSVTKKDGSAIPAAGFDFGTHDKNTYDEATASYNVYDSVIIKVANADKLTSNIKLETTTSKFGVVTTSISKDDLDANGEKKVAIYARTNTDDGEYTAYLRVTSNKTPVEFDTVDVKLTHKVLGPSITFVENNTSNPISTMAFGNVGQRFQKSFVYGIQYSKLEAGDLSFEITGTDADAFAFYSSSDQTINISSAGNGSLSSLSFHQATETVGDYSATLKVTGCGLPTAGITIPITMSVKAPVVETSVSSLTFTNARQHEITTKTFKITGQYLSYSIRTSCSGAVFNALNSSESYYTYPDENGEIDETITVSLDARYNVNAGNYNSTLNIASTANIAEFTAFDAVSLSGNVIATYGIEIMSDWAMGYVSVNGSSPLTDTTVYVASSSESVSIKALPNLGKAFSQWIVTDSYYEATFADADAAETTVTATEATKIRPYFVNVCIPLLRPYYPEVDNNTKTYNSIDLLWEWVTDNDDNKISTYKVQVTDVEMDEVVATKSVSFTSAQLAESEARYTLTNLWGNTDYSVVVWATTTASGYCEEGNKSAKVEFTTADYPAATLTLSENGVERTYEGTHKLNDMVPLPSEVVTGIVGKEFMGWSANASCTIAPEYDKGQQYKLTAVANKLYAVYATATPGTPTDHNLGSATFNGSNTGGNTASTGYTLTTNKTADKTGYIQDSGTKDATIIHVQISASSQIISEQPSAIIVSAKLGGSSTKNPLGYDVYAVLVDENGDAIGASVVLTDKITDANGSDFSAELPINNYADVRGVKIYHMKEDGWNVRYYNMSLKYQTGGESSYSAYTTTGPRLLALPAFTPAEGTYTSAQNIAISAAEGTIYYNVDSDSDPTSASTAYSSAIALDTYGEHVIKAIAIDGDNKSNVATATYFMNLPFASLQDLVDANLPATGTEDVTVSFSSIAIDSIKNSSKSVYLHVLADGKGIYIYNGAAACPTTWEVDGRLSGTITGKWIKFNDKEWEIVPNSGFAWTDLTYTKASVSATPNTLNLGTIKQNFGDLSKTFTLSGEGVTKSVKLTTNSIRLSVSPSVVSATDVLAGKEITVTGTSSWSGDQEYTVSVATEEAPYEVVATNLVTVSWSVTPTNIVYVTTNNTVYGTVKINSSTSGQWAVTATEEFTLDATALSGYEFDKWTTDDDSKVTIADINDASTTAVATGSVTITANFKKIPVGVLTLSKNVIDFGIVKKGTSVSSQLFTLSGTGFTPGNTISLSFTGTDDYYGLSNDEYTADSEGKISEKSVTVLVDNTATASYGSKDCSLKISGDDLASDSIVAIKLTVGEEIVVPTITGGSLTWDGGVAPSAAVVGSEHTLAAVPASGYTGGEIAILKAEDDSDVTDDVMSGSTLTVPSYAIKVVVSGFEATAHPSGLGWRYGGEDVTTHAHTFGASTERFYFPQLKNPNEIDLDDIEFVSSDSTVAEFGARTHEYSSWFAAVWVKKAGTAVMTARLKNHATYDDIEVSYTLTVSKGELADNQFRWFQYPDIYSPESDTYTWYESHSWPYINASSTYVDKNTEVTYESTDESVATISSTGSITPVANGSTVIKAKFIGNDKFNAKTIQFTLTVQKASPVLSWSSTPTSSNTTVDLADSYGLYTFPRFGSVSPYVDALKDLVVLSSSNTAVAEINSDGYVNPLSAGTTTIKLSLVATDKSNAAEDISYTFTVTDSRPELTIVAGDHGTYQVKDNSNTYVIESGSKIKANTNLYLVSLSAETGYKNTPTYKVVKTSDNTDVTSDAINGSYLKMQAFDITISATYPEKAVAPIGWSSTETQYAYTDDREYTLPTLVNAGLSVTFASSNTSVATVSNGQVTVLSAGTTNISISYAGDENYKQTTVSYELVVRAPHHLNVTGQPNKLMYDYGESINFTGMTATLYYSENDNSDGVDVTDVATWSSTPATVTASGQMTLTASYKGKEGSRLEYIYLKQYEVTFSNPANAHGTIVVKQNGTAISSHDAFPKGTVLTVEATPDAGYKLSTLTANGDDIMAAKQFTIGTTEVTVAASFVQDKAEAGLAWSANEGHIYTAGPGPTSRPSLTNPYGVPVTYSVTDATIASVDETGWVVGKASGSTTITATFAGNDTVNAGSASYTVNIHKPASLGFQGSARTWGYEAGDDLYYANVKAQLKYDGDNTWYTLSNNVVEWSSDPISVTNPTATQSNVILTASAYGVSNQMLVSVTINRHVVLLEQASGGSISVFIGETLVQNYDQFVKGTELTVYATPSSGYELEAITVNGEPIEGNIVTIGTVGINISATFKSGATALDEAAVEAEGARKVIIDSKLFIIRGDKMFDAQGKLVK